VRFNWKPAPNTHGLYFLADKNGKWVATYNRFPECDGWICSVEGGDTKFWRHFYDVENYIEYYLGDQYGRE
jgi:hypothetical protein